MSARKYGAAPIDIGLVDLHPTEMMFWLYLPIKAPGGEVVLPPNLQQFSPIIDDVWPYVKDEDYLYLTVKTCYVSSECPGNRPGWHSDGFMTDDINFIWYDANPTLFWVPKNHVQFTQDHRNSLSEMGLLAGNDSSHHVTYPLRHLLKLDEAVIHRVGDVLNNGIRTFVKVSVSRNRYDLLGNSINHALDVGWKPEANRDDLRNHPTSFKGKVGLPCS